MADAAERPTLSVVIPCYNESKVFPYLRDALTAFMGSIERDWRVEIVLVDDGSRDDTWEQICGFAEADGRVRGISLSRNFSHQAALTCGYRFATGDAVACMDADLQDPPEVIKDMLEKWREGADVVYAVREVREGESAFKRWTAAAFYRIARAMGATHLQSDSGDFRLLSRRAVRALNEMPEYHRFIRGMVGWIGFKAAVVRYQRKARQAGETKYTLRKMVRFASDAIVSFSIFPLRLAYLAAIVSFLMVLAYLAYVVVMHWVFGEPLVPGWSSLLLVITVFGAINLLCVGIMGEYLGRTYEQTKGRPVYFVGETTEDRRLGASRPAAEPPPDEAGAAER